MSRTSKLKQSVSPSLSPILAISKLQRQLERLDEVIKLEYSDGNVDAWKSTTQQILDAAFGLPDGEKHPTTAAIIYAQGGPMNVGFKNSDWQNHHVKTQMKRKALLSAAIEQLQDQAEMSGVSIIKEDAAELALTRLTRLLTKFHAVAIQLRHRHADRETLDIDDEYDVQDLLLALLRVEFDDVRKEESMPSTASTNPRLDILLKREQIVIEVKKTRVGLADKQLGQELIQDIATYQTHPDCKVLVCFIYDPDHRVRNIVGLQADLARVGAPKLRVETVVTPLQ